MTPVRRFVQHFTSIFLLSVSANYSGGEEQYRADRRVADERRAKRGKDAGSVNGSAIGATEDAAPRSSVASARARKRAAVGWVAVAMGLFLTATPAYAASAPAWSVDAAAIPAKFSLAAPVNRYTIVVANTGSATSEPGVTLTDHLPEGLRMTGTTGYYGPGATGWACEEPHPSEVICTYSEEPIPPATHAPALEIEVSNPQYMTPLPLRNEISVSGGGALHSATVTQSTPVGSGAQSFGIQAFEMQADDEAGVPEQLAGGHPWQVSTALNFPTRPAPEGLSYAFEGSYLPVENIKRLAVELPAGVVGNLFAGERCTEDRVYTSSCPAGSQVGITAIAAGLFPGGMFITSSQFRNPSFLYRTTPAAGYPAEIVFGFAGQIVPLYATVVHSPAGERVRFISPPGIPEVLETSGILFTLFGHPGAINGTESTVAAITDPARCGEGPQNARMEVETWANPGHTLATETPLFPEELKGCEGLSFEPTLTASPTTGQAESPTGLGVDIHVPQPQGFEERATPPLKDATVTLPEGLVANPALADGLGACKATGPEGINLGTDDIGPKGEDLGNPEATELGAGHLGGNGSPYDDNVYHTAPGHCPGSSTLGTVEVNSPIVAEPLEGHIYLGAPECAPCTNKDAEEGKLIKLYIEAAGDGVIVKLPGTTTVDPATGRLTATFRDNPQLPFEDLRVDFKQGPRAPLATPAACGTYTTTTDLTPWSSQPAPGEAEGTPDATPASSFEVSSGPGGGPCLKTPSEAPNKPVFTAGTTNPSASAYSPFELEISREDGSQRLRSIDATLPPGLVAKLAGVGECSEAQIAAAQAPGRSGAAEQASPSCPPNTEVGTVNVGAGAGPNPFHVTGHAYLAGPYKGAPISLAIITPAIAGPFDLGTVVVRVALHVDPETAVVTAKSDPLPQILAGIPLDVRSVALNMSRPSFTLNPTNCNPSAVAASVLADSSTATLSSPFQVGGCSALAFKPKLAISLKGGTRRNKNPALKAVLTYPKGNYANIARAQVTLPHSEFLDQAHIGTVCTRVQFAAGNGNGAQCPPGSIYGHARAITPLLDNPIEGPVYLRSSSHKLPDLVAALNGQIDVALAGKVDTGKNGGIRNTFEVVPDAPVSKFVLSMKGGSKGLLVNSENICKKPQKALAHFVAQNGKVDNFSPTIANSCKSHKHKKSHRGAHK